MVAALCGFPARPRLRPPAGPAPRRRYERRRPEKTPLHKVISENLASWLEWRDQAERPVPGSVEEEFRAYLECGILCFGFGRALCTGCGQGVAVAFSCKGRGVCPSCNGRHMAQTAAAGRPRLGAVSFLHRFGSALNRHVHLHACVTDGVFTPAAAGSASDAPPAFVPARPINPADLAALTERVRRRVIRWFRLAHLLDASAAADMLGWENSGVVELTPFEFLDRLADLVPPPRKHRHRYHGVFAPNHPLRPAVTALAIGNIGKRQEAASGGHARDGLPLECPSCGGDIRLIAFITEPGPIRKILTHLGEPLAPARGPQTRGTKAPGPADWEPVCAEATKNAAAVGCGAIMATGSSCLKCPLSLLKGAPPAPRPLRKCRWPGYPSDCVE